MNTNDSVMLSYAYAEPIRPPVKIASFFILLVMELGEQNNIFC